MESTIVKINLTMTIAEATQLYDLCQIAKNTPVIASRKDDIESFARETMLTLEQYVGHI